MSQVSVIKQNLVSVSQTFVRNKVIWLLCNLRRPSLKVHFRLRNRGNQNVCTAQKQAFHKCFTGKGMSERSACSLFLLIGCCNMAITQGKARGDILATTYTKEGSKKSFVVVSGLAISFFKVLQTYRGTPTKHLGVTFVKFPLSALVWLVGYTSWDIRLSVCLRENKVRVESAME